MGVLDDYMGQVKSYDAGKPGTSVKPKLNTKFQSAESGGMSMPATNGGTKASGSPLFDIKYDSGAVDAFDKSRKGFSGRLTQQPKPGSSTAKTDIGSMLNSVGHNGEERTLWSVIEPSLRGSAIRLPGVQQEFKAPGGKYDETTWRNNAGKTNMPVDAPSLPAGDTPFIANRSASGTERFDPGKLTLGNTPSGKVGMFKDGQMLDTAAAQKELGINRAPGSFIGKINTDNLGGTIDFTKQFAQDDKIFKMRMQNGQNDPQFFTGPGEPGPGTYGPNSEASAFRSRRDMLTAQVDDFNRKNPITSGMSVGDIVSNTLATSQARNEIKHIDEQIFGRTQLSNKIMEALIGKDTTLQAQGMKNQGDFATQQLENIGIMDARRLMEGAETQRNRESIVAGRYAGKGNEDLEKKKTKLDLLKSLGIEGYKGKIAAGDYDGASKFATDFMNQHFGNDDELNEIFK